HQVALLAHGLTQAHPTGGVADAVLRPPGVAATILEDHRGIEHDRRRVEATLEGRGIEERLEAGAGLPARLRRPVELAAREAEPARQRPQCTGVRFQGYQCGLRTR